MCQPSKHDQSRCNSKTMIETKPTTIANSASDEEALFETPKVENFWSHLTSLAFLQYTISISLLVFSTIITHIVIFQSSTKLSSFHPSIAAFTLWVCLLWLGVMEGQQASLVGLTNGVIDHSVYKDCHVRAWKGVMLVKRGNNLDR